MTRYEDYSTANQAAVRAAIRQIHKFWNCSPTDAIPQEMQPDLDSCEWGLPLLRSLVRLAATTRNDHAKALHQLEISALMRATSQDFAPGSECLRVEDVRFALEALGAGGDFLEEEDEDMSDKADNRMAEDLKKKQAKVKSQPVVIESQAKKAETLVNNGEQQPKASTKETASKQKRPGRAARFPKAAPKSASIYEDPDTLLDSLLPQASKKRSAPVDEEENRDVTEEPPQKKLREDSAPVDKGPETLLASSLPRVSNKRSAPDDEHDGAEQPAQKKLCQDNDLQLSATEDQPSDNHNLNYLFSGIVHTENGSPRIFHHFDFDEAADEARTPSPVAVDNPSPAMSQLNVDERRPSRATQEGTAAPRALSPNRRRVLRGRQIRDVQFDIEHAKAMMNVGAVTVQDWTATLFSLRKKLARLQDEEEDDASIIFLGSA
jgi:hypothetical protein